MPGPPLKPTHLKVIEGNPGKRALSKNEPKPAIEKPSLPQHLSAEAKKEWRRIVRELLKLGVVTKIDRAALAAYCEAWATWKCALEKLAVEEKVIKAPSGYPVLNPLVTIANKAAEHMHKFLVEFRMTPASR